MRINQRIDVAGRSARLIHIEIARVQRSRRITGERLTNLYIAPIIQRIRATRIRLVITDINRINLRANIEAMHLVEDGVATVEDIDKGLRLASGRKMGPFETGDMIGLDVTLGALTAIFEETKDPAWHAPAILRRKVKAGHLGRKTGRGWYKYNEDGTRTKK